MRPGRLSVMPPLPPGSWGRAPSTALPFPIGEPGAVVTARARHGLWHAVRRLGLGPGDEVLVPAYHHGSEVEALVRAGLTPRFYGGQPDLAPDALELDRLCGTSVRALYLIHTLGFPQDAARWRRWCDDRGLLLLEDAAMAWLSTVDGCPVGSLGDAAIFCLYKTYGLPDGAAVVVPSASDLSLAGAAVSSSRLALTAVARAHARWAAQVTAEVRCSRRGQYDHRADIALGDVASAPSAPTAFLLPRLVDPTTAARRRANAALLLEALGDAVPPPFDCISPGAAPFAVPVTTPRKALLLELLAHRGIDALDLWSLPHPSVPDGRFPAVDERRRSTVALPVHHELRSSDIERVADAARRRPRRPVTVDVAERIDAPGDLAAEWTALACGHGDIFSTWEWAATWYRHLGAGRPLRIVTCRSTTGRLLAVVPLCVARSGPVPLLRFVGHGPADQLGPVCAPGDRARVASAIRGVLADLAPAILIAEHLSPSSGWGARLGGRVLRSEAAPTARLTGLDWDGYLAERSPNLRQQVRRFERRLLARQGAVIRCGSTPERLSADFETLFSLHNERWSDGRSHFAGAHRDFHEAFAATALEQGWLRLWTCEVEGRPVAAWYGFRFAGVESYYQAGRDPSWAGEPVGLVLLARSIRAAIEDGLDEYRFLRGGESFKYRFADADPGLETIGVARGVAGRAAIALLGGLPEAAVPPLRRWLVG